MAPRVHFEPVMVGLLSERYWTVVRVGDDRVGVIRPASRSRMVFEPHGDRPISATALRNIANMVEQLSRERIAQQRTRSMKTYLVWIVTVTNEMRVRRDPTPVGCLMALSAKAAREQARKEFHLQSNQRARVRADRTQATRIAKEIAIASSVGVSLSFADAYRFIWRPRKRGERFNSTKARRTERYCSVHTSAPGNGVV